MDERRLGVLAKIDWVVVGIIALATLVRVVAIFDQPWMDEIWSQWLAQHANSPWQIMTAAPFHQDNNHWLNTIYLWALGPLDAWWPCRLLSLAGGVGVLGFVAVIAGRWDRTSARIAVSLVGFSFIFVEYASEARGYGPAVCCATALLWALLRLVDRKPRPAIAAAVFIAACVLGFLSHATFVYVFLGAAIYAPVALYQAGRRPAEIGRELLILFAGPTLFFVWLYVVAIRTMTIGGGPHEATGDVVAQTVNYTVGLPVAGFAGWTCLIIAMAWAGHGAFVLARERREEWVFLLGAGVVAPLLIVAVRQPQPMFPRYLFVALPFVLLLVAISLRDLLRRGPIGRIVVSALLVGFLAGNGRHLWRFYAVGRGQNREMLQLLVARTDGPEISLAAAQKFRANLIFQYYAPRVAMNGKAFRYFTPDNPQPPEWFLVDSGTTDAVQPIMQVAPWPVEYQLTATFPSYGLSGTTWYVFHRR